MEVSRQEKVTGATDWQCTGRQSILVRFIGREASISVVICSFQHATLLSSISSPVLSRVSNAPLLRSCACRHGERVLLTTSVSPSFVDLMWIQSIDFKPPEPGETEWGDKGEGEGEGVGTAYTSGWGNDDYASTGATLLANSVRTSSPSWI